MRVCDACACVCMRERVKAGVVGVCMCVCVREREKESVCLFDKVGGKGFCGARGGWEEGGRGSPSRITYIFLPLTNLYI